MPPSDKMTPEDAGQYFQQRWAGEGFPNLAYFMADIVRVSRQAATLAERERCAELLEREMEHESSMSAQDRFALALAAIRQPPGLRGMENDER